MVKDTLDQFGRDALLDAEFEKEKLAVALDVSTRSIESLVHFGLLAVRRSKRKNLYRLSQAIETFRSYELRARRQDTALNRMERDILRAGRIDGLFVDGRLYFTKRRMAQKCRVSITTIESWTRKGLTPVTRIFRRKNLYPALPSLLCLCRNRRIRPEVLAFFLWFDEP